MAARSAVATGVPRSAGLSGGPNLVFEGASSGTEGVEGVDGCSESLSVGRADARIACYFGKPEPFMLAHAVRAASLPEDVTERVLSDPRVLHELSAASPPEHFADSPLLAWPYKPLEGGQQDTR